MNPNECSTNLWVFGYGSLCWLQGFDYGNHQLGFIRGFSRKFWQGNNSHRGTNDKPGRVATLIKEDEAVTWGLAFELLGETALRYLNDRECTKGGYETLITTFFPRNGVMTPFPVLVFRATEHNPQWLGPAPLADVAAQVTECKGEAGHNSEYVLRLAEFFRDNLPEVHDEHLFTLERLVLKRMKEKNISSTEDAPVTQAKQEVISIAVAAQPDNNPGQENRRDSFQYSSRVPPSKKLLCLKV
ncbi:hypothetical protein GHT06_022498 [Daphnia sinensis]|uniref:glutathione-specific gamma-glutamylcyclotransferase n=1 Tax=Daphnia sinensis TaxID=1820382 RepID=A0AAD5KXY3_9CRUS|nr:hypothetical protein GHT06_022498 [Daphnia sinensis]